MWGYDFEIIYKQGKQNIVADVILRKEEDTKGLLCVISSPQSNKVEEERINLKHVEKACKIIHQLGDPIAIEIFVWKNYLLW